MDESAGRQFHLWARLGCLVVSASALFVIFRKIESHELLATFSRVKIGWFLFANVLFGSATLLAAARWHLILRLNNCLVHSGATLRTVFIGHVFNTLLFGPAGGDLAKAAIYSDWYRRKMSSVLATCYLDRLLGGFGFFLLSILLPSVAGLSGGFSFGSTLLASSARWWVTGIGIALLATGILLHLRFRNSSPLRKFLRDFLSGGRQLLARPRTGGLGTAYAFSAHVCTNVMLLVCLQAVVERPLPLAQMLWTSPIIALVSSAPVTFAGTGLREGAALVLFGLYGVSAADAVAASLLVLLSYLIWAAIGSWLFFRERRWHQPTAKQALPEKISVVIPTLNEAANLEATIRCAREVPEICEIIVADGGSTDETAKIAVSMDARVLLAPRGRGSQLRAGAELAKGDVVLLLHADTWLPSDAGRAILDCCRDSRVVAGGFWKIFREGKILMIGARLRCALRLLIARRILGDQAIFIRREPLLAIGGIPNLPLMEEFELCRKLRGVGRLALASATVSTSARRFAKLGVIRTYLRMWRVTIQYYLGTSPQKLGRLYDKE